MMAERVEPVLHLPEEPPTLTDVAYSGISDVTDLYRFDCVNLVVALLTVNPARQIQLIQSLKDRRYADAGQQLVRIVETCWRTS